MNREQTYWEAFENLCEWLMNAVAVWAFYDERIDVAIFGIACAIYFRLVRKL